MGVIRQRLWVAGSRGRLRLGVLFDSGSSLSLLREEFADRLGVRDQFHEPKTCYAAIGTFVAREYTGADILIRRHHIFAVLALVPDLSEEVILGADFLQRWHIKLDPFRRRIIVDPEELRLRA